MGLLDRLAVRAPAGGLVREVSMLAGTSGAAQALTILALPLLARLYTPEDFGVLAVFLSIFTIAYVVVALRYDQAIPLPRDSRQALAVLVVAGLSVAATSSVVLLVVAIGRDGLADLLGEPAMSGWLLLLPAALLGAGLNQVLVGWAVRERQSASIAQSRLGQSLSQVGVQIATAIAAVPGGLMLGVVAGRIAGSTRLALNLRRSPEVRAWPNRQEVMAAARRYARFPLLGGPAALLNTAAVELFPLVLAAQHGVTVAGLFLLGNRLIGAPLNLIGSAVSQVYVGRYAHAQRERPADIRPLFRATSSALAAVGIIPAVVILLAAPTAIETVMGAPWREAGVYAQLLAVMFWAQLAVFPLEPTLGLAERQDLQLRRDAGRLAAVLVAVAAAVVLDLSARATVLLYGVTMTLAYGAMYLLLVRVVRVGASESR